MVHFVVENSNGVPYVSSVMPQSLSNVLIHTVFSTKDRFPFLEEPTLRAETHAFMSGVTDKLDCHAIRIGGVADHVHLLTEFSRTITIADFVKETKRATTVWLQEEHPHLAKFHWQAGYGTFSVSESMKAEVATYIEAQEEHHRRVDFKTEFRNFCERNGEAIDERYVWD